MNILSRFCLISALSLVAWACADEVLVERVPPEPDGLVECSIVCSYTDPAITTIRADVTPCETGGPCSTCESCSNALDYHTTIMSCEDGQGRTIVTEPLECP